MKLSLQSLQPLGRALMLPIAVLPIAGLLLRLGQPDLLDIPFVAAAGGAIFDNLGLLFALARLDPRVRSVEQLERYTGLMVLATVPFYSTPRDRRREQLRNVFLVATILAVVLIYLLLFGLKLKGMA